MPCCLRLLAIRVAPSTSLMVSPSCLGFPFVVLATRLRWRPETCLAQCRNDRAAVLARLASHRWPAAGRSADACGFADAYQSLLGAQRQTSETVSLQRLCVDLDQETARRDGLRLV